MISAFVTSGGVRSEVPAPFRFRIRSQEVRSVASPRDFLEDLSRRSFLYFWEQAHPLTGLVPDRLNFEKPLAPEASRVASIAATGFGLTALCIGAQRGWVDEADAHKVARTALRFIFNDMPQKEGWFFHFVDHATGQRRWSSEVSSIDTALLLAGVLTVRQCFSDWPEIYELASKIYDRVNFQWMLNGHQYLLSHGWKPETGFIAARWDAYSELMILYMLGIGSTTHPLEPESWYAWHRDAFTYQGYSYVWGAPPLFIHQFSHAWIDFRNRRERNGTGIDWFENSKVATRAHREFFIDLNGRFPSYSNNFWGLTASESPEGYVSWGGPPLDPMTDGSIVPCASAGSLMFTPDIAIPAVVALYETYGNRIFSRYGFVDAFNSLTGWIAQDYIGIDVGITLLSAENQLNGSVWDWFMKNPEIQDAMELIELK